MRWLKPCRLYSFSAASTVAHSFSRSATRVNSTVAASWHSGPMLKVSRMGMICRMGEGVTLLHYALWRRSSVSGGRCDSSCACRAVCPGFADFGNMQPDVRLTAGSMQRHVVEHAATEVPTSGLRCSLGACSASGWCSTGAGSTPFSHHANIR
jgi:hypothetical protein